MHRTGSNNHLGTQTHTVRWLPMSHTGSKGEVRVGNCDVFFTPAPDERTLISAFCMFARGLICPPSKWSSVKYYFRMEDKIDGKEEAYG